MVNSVHETQDSSDIKNASKASRLGKNILPYDAIQTMLHTEIKNIEQRIHNQKTKSGIKRKSRKF